MDNIALNSINDFWNECKKVGDVLLATQDDRAAEPQLVNILTLVKRSPPQREAFVKAFLEILENPDKWSGLIVQFCMHELRYPELKQHCLERLKNDQSRYDRTLPRRVLEAYENQWWERRVFDYYSKQD